jgi:hypothetical protein
MQFQILPHHKVGRTSQCQETVVVQLQYSGKFAEDMRGRHTMMQLDVVQVLGTDMRVIILRDLVGQLPQGEPAHPPSKIDRFP